MANDLKYSAVDKRRVGEYLAYVYFTLDVLGKPEEHDNLEHIELFEMLSKFGSYEKELDDFRNNPMLSGNPFTNLTAYVGRRFSAKYGMYLLPSLLNRRGTEKILLGEYNIIDGVSDLYTYAMNSIIQAKSTIRKYLKCLIAGNMDYYQYLLRTMAELGYTGENFVTVEEAKQIMSKYNLK